MTGRAGPPGAHPASGPGPDSATIERLRRELAAARAELEKARQEIAWMRSSRFWRLREAWWRLKGHLARDPAARAGSSASRGPRPGAPLSAFPAGTPVPPDPAGEGTPVDVVVCVHDALADVKGCLDSVVRHTRAPYRLVVVDDGSGDEARRYLEEFAEGQGATLLRNSEARGYTRAANQGLAAGTSPFAVLLNSDTVVTPEWLERLVGCAESDPAVGLAGPVSNCASWQSVPEVFDAAGDWNENPLEEGIPVDRMAALLRSDAAPVRPRLPFLNGFCLLVRRALLSEVGFFDEETFGRGYGEENDLCLRAAAAGWQAAVADDSYVFHSQSRSYSGERRQVLSRAAGEALNAKHGTDRVVRGVEACRASRELAAVRARARGAASRARRRDEARSRWEGRRVLFVLPVCDRGGGANVVLSEAAAMTRMGVDARVLNLEAFRPYFERSYPSPQVPVTWVREEDVPAAARRFDAVVATAFSSVEWLLPLAGEGRPPALGYYVQDFEPLFFGEGTSDHRRALDSYGLVPGMRLFCKTEWNRDAVESRTGFPCSVVGPSYDFGLFRPVRPAPPPGPLRVAAMVRPETPRRQPRRTVEVLAEAKRLHGEKLDVVLFGADPADPAYLAMLPGDVPLRSAGRLDGPALASLLNDVHAFVDLSTYQAMGLTALEAMACGAAAVVPREGGASDFARDGESALFVDTGSPAACLGAVSRLVEEGLAPRLAARGLEDAPAFHPETAAFAILERLFGAEGDADRRR